MGDNNEKEWYSNKQIHKMVVDLMKELALAQVAMKKYNNLHPQISDLKTGLGELQQIVRDLLMKGKGKQNVEAAFLRWLPAIVAVAALIISFLK